MSWLLSLLVALLTAGAGLVAAGFLAALAIDWYRVSSREGAAGYFFITVAFLGSVASFLIGLTVARLVARGVHPGFLRALGISLGIVVALGGSTALALRLLADIPPTIGGEHLHLMVEFRWPADQRDSPATLPGEGYVRLGSLPYFSRRLRTSERGPLWKEEARLIDGRWVVPGAVEIFTRRGRRVLDVGVAESTLAGFLIPLPARPGRKHFEWTKWEPQPRGGQAWPPDRFSYRYRVQPRSVPVRSETVGPFQVATIASRFYESTVDSATRIAAFAEFGIRHRERPVLIERESAEHGRTWHDRADGVATLPGPEAALVIHVSDRTGGGASYLLVGVGDSVRIEEIGTTGQVGEGLLLTSDRDRFWAARARRVVDGTIDRVTFAEPGLFLVGDGVLDTRRKTVRRLTGPARYTGIVSIPPLGVSPDERSFVRFAYADGDGHQPVLIVTEMPTATTYTLPIDPVRMRYRSVDTLDPDFIHHHFEWRRGPDGIDRMVEMPFVPIPYRGEVSLDYQGRPVYQLEPAGPGLRDAVVDFLIRELGGERVSAEPDAFEHQVRVRGKMVNAARGDGHVSIATDRDTEDPGLIREIARRFDAALATGRYDSLFVKPRA